MQRVLAELDPLLREAFLLKYIEEMSYEEMSALTGVGVSALKMRVKRACDRLRDRWERIKDDVSRNIPTWNGSPARRSDRSKWTGALAIASWRPFALKGLTVRHRWSHRAWSRLLEPRVFRLSPVLTTLAAAGLVGIGVLAGGLTNWGVRKDGRPLADAAVQPPVAHTTDTVVKFVFAGTAAGIDRLPRW